MHACLKVLPVDMETISHDDTQVNVAFKVPANWKREVDKKLIDLQKTLKQGCIEGLSKVTGVPMPEHYEDAA